MEHRSGAVLAIRSIDRASRPCRSQHLAHRQPVLQPSAHMHRVFARFHSPYRYRRTHSSTVHTTRPHRAPPIATAGAQRTPLSLHPHSTTTHYLPRTHEPALSRAQRTHTRSLQPWTSAVPFQQRPRACCAATRRFMQRSREGADVRDRTPAPTKTTSSLRTTSAILPRRRTRSSDGRCVQPVQSRRPVLLSHPAAVLSSPESAPPQRLAHQQH